ncbi:MAG: hypothetical protein KBF96_06825 [Ignavibacteria bacterium]|jgi:hypothetical protein|nr:hypothetical protein [Ignavibacteria bacterium]
MKIICLGIMIFLILNSFQIIKAQDIKTYNYELTKSNDTVRCGFYLKPSYPNPFGAVYNVYFGIYDSSSVSIKVYNDKTKDTVLLIDTTLVSGNYVLDWRSFSKNILFGLYVCVLECKYRNRGVFAEFKAFQSFIIIN